MEGFLTAADGAWLYVACANTNAVWVIDTKAGKGVALATVVTTHQHWDHHRALAISRAPIGRRLHRGAPHYVRRGLYVRMLGVLLQQLGFLRFLQELQQQLLIDQ